MLVIWGYIMTIGIIPLIAVELILAVLICWFTEEQTDIFGYKLTQQENFLKKYHSPIKIRPPPMLTMPIMHSKTFLSMMYS